MAIIWKFAIPLLGSRGSIEKDCERGKPTFVGCKIFPSRNWHCSIGAPPAGTGIAGWLFFALNGVLFLLEVFVFVVFQMRLFPTFVQISGFACVPDLVPNLEQGLPIEAARLKVFGNPDNNRITTIDTDKRVRLSITKILLQSTSQKFSSLTNPLKNLTGRVKVRTYQRLEPDGFRPKYWCARAQADATAWRRAIVLRRTPIK